MELRAVIGAVGLFGASTLAHAQAYGQDAGDTEASWTRLEAPRLTGHVQLTSRDDFIKAGEAYFDPTTGWIIFQAVAPPPEGEAPTEYFEMYVAKLVKDEEGGITGLDKPILISEPGSSNTCGWFHPTIPGLVLFGSTTVAPAGHEISGYDSGRYRWAFPREMEIVERYIPEIANDIAGIEEIPEEYAGIVDMAKPMFERDGYTAEGSWSPDGRYVLYAHADPEKSEARRPDADIWIYDTKTNTHHPIVAESGYDGGPFFSPDGRSICYRSDRRHDSLLQLYVSRLQFDGEGTPSRAEEQAITANDDVNWAPFWHPSGKLLIYASSEIGHTNYEIFSVEVDRNKTTNELAKRRITRATDTDILPVFNADASLMMWTAQRGPMVAGEDKPSSQLWVADVDPNATPSRWFHSISQTEAIDIAKATVAAQDGWPDTGLEINARVAEGDVWRIQVWKLPKGPGTLRVIELSVDGTVLRYITPD
jgi:hypothetical protein